MQLVQGAYFSFSDLSSFGRQGEIGKLGDIDQVLNVLGGLLQEFCCHIQSDHYPFEYCLSLSLIFFFAKSVHL